MKEAVQILIVEDEMIIAAKISMHLEQLGYDVVGIVPRGEEAVRHCRETPPDILLLDINLKGLLDGVETATVLQKELDIPIIYLTANTDDATFERAKTTHPYSFISKPYKKIDLQRAIELTISRMANRHGDTNKDKISEEDSTYILSDRIFVRHKERMIKLFLKDILYIEAERSYCRIHTQETEYLLSIPLREIEAKLQVDYFLRIHRSYIINLRQVDEVADTHIVVAQKAIPVGKSYKEELLRRIQLI